MGVRQPDVCLCFGGRCWKKFCPERSKPEPDPHIRPIKSYKGNRKRKRILNLRDSRAELEKNSK